MIINLVIDINKIPKGQGFKVTDEIYLGKSLEVSQEAKRMIDAIQIAFGHPAKRDTVRHILNAMAVSQSGTDENNKSITLNDGEIPMQGVQA